MSSNQHPLLTSQGQEKNCFSATAAAVESQARRSIWMEDSTSQHGQKTTTTSQWCTQAQPTTTWCKPSTSWRTSVGFSRVLVGT